MAGNHESIGTDRASTLLEIGPYLGGVGGSVVIERKDTQARGKEFDFTTGLGRVPGFLSAIEEFV
jgi:hypothetical protein